MDYKFAVKDAIVPILRCLKDVMTTGLGCDIRDENLHYHDKTEKKKLNNPNSRNGMLCYGIHKNRMSYIKQMLN